MGVRELFSIRWRGSLLARSFRVLPRNDRIKVGFVLILQIGLGLLDLAGVAAVGILGALAVSGVASREPGNRVYSLLSILNLEQQSLQTQATVLGLLAATFLVGKTVISVVFTRRILFFLSRRGATISANLLSKLLSQSLQQIQKRSLQENLYSVTSGVNIITVGILATGVTLIADISLLVIMTIGLFVVDTVIATSTLLLFGLIGFGLYKLMNVRAQKLGIQQTTLSVSSNQKIYEILSLFREIVVKNRREFYSRQIGEERLKLANNAAELAFIPNISKYVMELAVVVGSLIISSVQFYRYDAVYAVAILSVFLAASTRIAPAVLRAQQGAIAIKASIGAASPTLELIESLSHVSELKKTSDNLDTAHAGFFGRIEIAEITMRYEPNSIAAVKNVTFSVQEGESVGIVGPSGAGKTTLVDILLGIITPDSGTVSISGMSPLEAISAWPGSIAYVPQEVLITRGSIRENVAMGYPSMESHDDLIWEALRVAKLDQFVKELPLALDSNVGDRGVKLSGGQRQRLGIARAMYTKPKLLVLDEATSSLDGQTEFEISQAISGLHGSVTVLIIAHRLSTVKNLDKVVYMKEGEVRAVGNFEDVRSAIPEFDNQAKLMGL
jgi:ABC-type multidrug transport system fused ATPase/permease subunit